MTPQPSSAFHSPHHASNAHARALPAKVAPMAPIELSPTASRLPPSSAYAAFLQGPRRSTPPPSRRRPTGYAPFTTKEHHTRRHPLNDLAAAATLQGMIAVVRARPANCRSGPGPPTTRRSSPTGSRRSSMVSAAGPPSPSSASRSAPGGRAVHARRACGIWPTAAIRSPSSPRATTRRRSRRVVPQLALLRGADDSLRLSAVHRRTSSTPRAFPGREYNVKIVTRARSSRRNGARWSPTAPASPTRSPRTASLYGTADAGVLGNETPLSIEIRRASGGPPRRRRRELFQADRLPTLVQYDPAVRYFEESDGTLLFTGDNGIAADPLSTSADEGGLLSH